MDDTRILDWSVACARALAEVGEAGEDVRIPSCPDWNLRQLTGHVLGMFNGWFDRNVALEPGEDWSYEQGMALLIAQRAPKDFDDRRRALTVRVDAYVAEAGQRDMDDEVWFFDSVAPRRLWALRALTELMVHRWDAENAVDRRTPIPADIAATSLSETLELALPRWLELGTFYQPSMLPASGSIGLQATDHALSYRLDPWDGSSFATPTSELPDTVVRGSTEHLNLWFRGRVPTDRLEVTGDLALVEQWRIADGEGA